MGNSVNFNIYNQIINWISGYFDEYLQDNTEGLKIYFPNGWFQINECVMKNEQIVFEIKINSKSTTTRKKILKKLNEINVMAFNFYGNIFEFKLIKN